MESKEEIRSMADNESKKNIDAIHQVRYGKMGVCTCGPRGLL